MKKRVLLLLSFAFTALMPSDAQNPAASVVFKHQQSFPMNEVAFNSQSLLTPNNIEAYHYAEWNVSNDGPITKNKGYKRAIKNRNMGIGLMAGGGASLVLGAALMSDGITGIRRRSFNTSDLAITGRLYETYFGALFGIAGFGMAIPGGIVYARGVSKMKKIRATWTE